MTDASRRRWLGSTAGLALAAATRPGIAQGAWPNRPVRLVVPYAAGGGPDMQARKLAPELAQALGVNVIVENKVGAGGIVAGEVVAALPPDGYTILIGGATHVINKVMQPAIKFDPIRSFEPITQTSSSGTVLIVPSDSPYRSVQELVAAIRAKPAAFNYGSGGVGTAAHLAGGAFCKVLGLDAVHVPFRGSVEIVPGLLGGQVQFAFPIAGTAIAGTRGGKVRALAVTTPQQMPQLPDAPSLKELYGSELLVQESWGCLWVPAGTPRAIVDRIFEASHKALQAPAVREFHEQGGTPIVLSKSPEALAELTRAETDKWARIIKLIGVTPS
ncbi:MAG: tripartite tricarboxylate transporter substrate binding protein [Burkholderiales bacterium]|nr:MAG: tripartite tricarboxylate transporter substrate binding protein [Burkholderiales bacterium]